MTARWVRQYSDVGQCGAPLEYRNDSEVGLGGSASALGSASWLPVHIPAKPTCWRFGPSWVMFPRSASDHGTSCGQGPSLFLPLFE